MIACKATNRIEGRHRRNIRKNPLLPIYTSCFRSRAKTTHKNTVRQLQLLLQNTSIAQFSEYGCQWQFFEVSTISKDPRHLEDMQIVLKFFENVLNNYRITSYSFFHGNNSREMENARKRMGRRFSRITENNSPPIPTPGSIITMLRMQASAILLLEGYRVGKIYEYLDYKDQNSFNEVFKAYYSVGPLAFYKAIQNPERFPEVWEQWGDRMKKIPA